MGRDKARLRMGGVSMLARVRQTAEAAVPAPCRVIRRDLVPRRGPLGGIITALRTSRATAVIFLACDMPLVSRTLLRRLAVAARDGRSAFTVQHGRVGFPLVLNVALLPSIDRRSAANDLSLQSLARSLRARRLLVSERTHQLFNVNTPEDAARVRALVNRRVH